MPRFSFRSLSAPARVTTLLLILALGCFAYVREGDAPWEGEALKRVAKALDVDRREVPQSAFRDLEALGSYNLGVPAYLQIGLWYGCLIVGSLLTLAALTTRWWVPLTSRRPRGGNALTGASPKSGFHPRPADWIGLAAILLLATLLRAPHLDRALYFDEQDNLRRNFHGYLELRTDGEEIWQPADWREALFENRLGNNPVFLSLACQVSLRTWRMISGADRQRFDIVALRIPVFLAGLASIAALWIWLQNWGLRFSAALAALLAAVHPMHIDYSLQARGYAFVLFFVPLALLFAWLALKRNRWRDWFGLAFTVFFCLWSYAGSVYFAFSLCGGILMLLSVRWFRSRDPGLLGPITRLLAANAITGCLYILLIFPHLPPVRYHFGNVFELIRLEPYWPFYAWSHYSTGTSFPLPADVGELRAGTADLSEVLLQRFAPSEPVLALLQWGILPALLLGGFFWLRNRQRHDGWMIPASTLLGLGLLAPALALLHQQLSSLYFYYWYLSYALPVVLAGIAIGFHRFVLPQLQSARQPRGQWMGAAATLVFLGLFLWQVSPIGGRPGRTPRATPWPVNEEGVAAVEFRRGRSHWVATRDGQSFSKKDFYEPSERARAGRE